MVALLHYHKGDGRAVVILQLQACRCQLQAGEATLVAASREGNTWFCRQGKQRLVPARVCFLMATSTLEAYSRSKSPPDLQENPLLTTLQICIESRQSP